jgi:uncharacterized membrane protein YgcG
MATMMMTRGPRGSEAHNARAPPSGRASSASSSSPLRAVVGLLLLLASLAAPADAAAAAPALRPPPRRALLRRSGFYNRVTDHAWRQTDMSVRQEQQSMLILQRLRAGRSAAEANEVATSLLGSQNFERRGSVRTQNNLDMNLRRYARPGQSGALGAVYRRIHPRTFRTGDKDTDFQNDVWSNVMVGEMRSAQVRAELDQERLRRARQAAQERAMVPRKEEGGGGGGEGQQGSAGGGEGSGGSEAAAKGGR